VYQWYFENAPIAAATNETFTLRNANPTNAGNYWVVASNPVGSVTSRLARLQFVSSVRTAATHVRLDGVGYTAFPYPLAITVQGATGTLSKVVVTLHDFGHAFPAALDILLAGPRGQTVMLMSDAGPPMDGNAVNLTFDDDATSTLPPQDSSTRLTSGTYKPTDYFIVSPEDDPDDIFPAPAPPPPYGNALSAFHNTDANGTWHLFVINDGGFGTIWGWELTLIGVGGEVTVPPHLYLERREEETVFDFFWDGAPGLKLQHTKSLANPVWTDFPGSEGQSHAVVGMNEVSEFFRLFKP
jgi:hypothetical protein